MQITLDYAFDYNMEVGDFTLVKQLEEQGYGWLTEQQ
jgi:hypothetical protein